MTVEGYGLFVQGLRTALLYLAIVAAVVCALDWAVRTRRVSPFSWIARFMRGNIEPVMQPVERMVVRAGGMPSAAPWWMLGAIVVGGLLLLQLVDFAAGLVAQLAYTVQHPAVLPLLLVSWAISGLIVALMVRVVSSWFSMSPYSRWIRWSYVLTEWMLRPLRRLIPTMGMLDVSPLAAYGILVLVRWVILRGS